MSISYLSAKIIIAIKDIIIIIMRRKYEQQCLEKTKCRKFFQIHILISGLAVFAPSVFPQLAQSIEECLPAEGPAYGVVPQHRAASAVAVHHHGKTFLPTGAPQHRTASAVAAACDQNEASAFPQAQQRVVCLVAAVANHYVEASVVV